MRYCCLILLFFLLYTGPAGAQSLIDSTFAQNGYVNNLSIQKRDAQRIVQLKGGRLLVIGKYYAGANNLITVSAFQSNGQPDTRIGPGGYRNITLPTNAIYYLTDAVLTTDSSLIMMLWLYHLPNYNTSCMLVKTSLKGRPDSSFALNGIKTIPTPDGMILKTDGLVVNRQGNILVSFQRNKGGVYRSYITRYTPAGDLDTLFQNKGVLKLYKFGEVAIESMSMLSDNRYVFSYRTGASTIIQVDVRDSNGNLPAAEPLNDKLYFDTRNYVKYSYGLKVGPNDTICIYLALGHQDIYRPNDIPKCYLHIYKYTRSALPVKGFGTNSLSILYLGQRYVSEGGIDALRIDSKNRIVFSIREADTFLDYGQNTIPIYDTKIYRLHANGTFDETFNRTGMFTDFNDNAKSDEVKDLAVTEDNRIVFAGMLMENPMSFRQMIGRLKETLPRSSSVASITDSRSITVYPQPFSSTLNIGGLEGVFDYTICTISGQTLASGRSENGSINHLGDLPSGMYVLLIQNGQQQFVLKVVKG